MMVGDTHSGKTTVLKNLNIPHPIDSPKFGFPEKDPAISWWFYEKGIVIDPAGYSLFSDAKAPKGSDWTTLLKNLSRIRGKCPLDGLILTVPANYFIGKYKLTEEDLRQKADALSDQLIKTEKYLGIKLPVYILITKCDYIAGFKGYSNELMPNTHNEMMGWSNPYTTDMNYNPRWIGEAFKTIYGYLFEGVLRIFSRGRTEEYRDDVMIFPQSFELLQEGMQKYIDRIFKIDDYRDHFSLRGIYLTGDANIEPASSVQFGDEIPKESHWKRKIKLPFLKDLFAKKIFQEEGIASPIKRFLTTTNRTISYLKIGIITAVILGSLSLYFGQYSIRKSIAQIQPAFSKILHDLQLRGGHVVSENQIGSFLFEKRAQAVLDLVSKASQYRINSIFIPSSWFSTLNSAIDQEVYDVYNLIIARPMYMSFNAKAEKIMRTELPKIPELPGKQRMVLDPTSTPEFLALEGFVDAILMLEDRSVLYNNLTNSRDSEALQKVAKYLFNFSFSDAFLKDRSSLKTRVIGQAHYKPFDVSNYRLYAEKRLYELYNNFLECILDPKYIYALASQLQETLEDVDGSGIPDIQSFRKTLIEIKQLVNFISSASGSWLTKPEFDPGSKYHETIQKVQKAKIFNKNVAKRLAVVSEKVYEKATSYLKTYGSPVTGYFFTTSGQTKRLKPSPGLVTLEKGLGLFLNKPFMALVKGEPFVAEMPKGDLLHWDKQMIQNAIGLIEAYNEFLKEELPGYPADIQDTLRVVGLKQLQRNINVMLGRAQTFYEEPTELWSRQAEDAARAQVDNINLVGPLFTKLLNKLDDIGSIETYTNLRNLLFEQMYGNLKKLDKILMESDYFSIGDEKFQWWDKGDRAILRAYNMADRHEMQAYIHNQARRMMHLVREYAAPVMKFLKSDVFAMNLKEVKLFDRWLRLMNAASEYENDKADSSLKILETFMLEEGNQITFENCFEKITKYDAEQVSGDYFLNRRNILRRGIYHRCQEVTAGTAAMQYNKMADFFNKHMAGAFPFIAGVPEEPVISADVSDKIMEEFFKLYDVINASARESIRSMEYYSDSWNKAKAFLIKMDKVRDFFNQYLAPKEKDGAPGMDVEIEFRQNKMREKHADQVMDWAVILGENSFSEKEGKLPIRWQLGNNTAFGFQWAVNAPLRPVENSGPQALALVAGRAMFVYQGYWALLRAMMIHQTPTKEGGQTNSDTLLKFEIPLGYNPQLSPVDNAILFMKVIPLTSNGVRSPNFKIPEFPTEAPMLISVRKGGS
jgi:type VI secretion system protein ImpL